MVERAKNTGLATNGADIFDMYSLTPYMGVCGFFLLSNLLPPYLLCSQGDKNTYALNKCKQTIWFL